MSLIIRTTHRLPHLLLAPLLVLGLIASGCAGHDDGEDPGPVRWVFSPENNVLNVYDALDSDRKQTLIFGNESGRDPVIPSVNAQVCFAPDGSRQFVLGNDAAQPNPPPGWGIFQLHGDRVGELSYTETGRLIPTYQGGPSTGDNYGCGYLPDGRLLTSDIGEQVNGPGTGQLIVWFPPFELDYTKNRYCKIDLTIATAGGIYIDEQERVYVGSARNDAGIYRYSGVFPTSPDAAGGCGRIDDYGSPLVDEGRITKERFLSAPDGHIFTPNSMWPSGHGTFYVCSVLNGVIAEYDANGAYVQTILAPPAGEMLGSEPYSTGTPLGISVDSDGTIYYADLGLVFSPDIGPKRDAGSLRRIRFENGQPLPPEIVEAGLTFPDGLGILEK